MFCFVCFFETLFIVFFSEYTAHVLAIMANKEGHRNVGENFASPILLGRWGMLGAWQGTDSVALGCGLVDGRQVIPSH